MPCLACAADSGLQLACLPRQNVKRATTGHEQLALKLIFTSYEVNDMVKEGLLVMLTLRETNFCCIDHMCVHKSTVYKITIIWKHGSGRVWHLFSVQ